MDNRVLNRVASRMAMFGQDLRQAHANQRLIVCYKRTCFGVGHRSTCGAASNPSQPKVSHRANFCIVHY